MARTTQAAQKSLVVGSPYFALLLWFTIIVFTVSVVIFAVLTLFTGRDPTPMQLQFASLLDTSAKITLGSLVGLLGAKANQIGTSST